MPGLRSLLFLSYSSHRLGLIALTNVSKSCIIDVADPVNLSLSLSGGLFQRCLSVRLIDQLVIQDETVGVVGSVLCKIIADKR